MGNNLKYYKQNNLLLMNKKIYNALVCGASEGIGKQTAIKLAQAGFRVTLISRSPDKLERFAEELNKINDLGHDFRPVDLSHIKAVMQVSEEIASDRDYSVIVNNNAGPKAGPLAKASAEEILEGITGHVVAAHILMQALLEGMIRSGYGRIINIISTSVKAPIAGLGVSNTVRGAMANWAKTLSSELGGHGITVNNVLPGFTATGRLDSLIEGKADKQGKSTDKIVSQMQSGIPLGRFAKPEETAEAIAFLASPQAAYINGINLPVDGGRLMSL
jgi:3-oxoacyl-[acyl-carrier protein] reductase